MNVSRLRLLLLLATLAVSGCAGMAGNPSSGDSAPVSGVPATCEHSCNREYDACMDRFSNASSGQSSGQRSDNAGSMLSPNDVCPDQVKGCMKRCSL